MQTHIGRCVAGAFLLVACSTAPREADEARTTEAEAGTDSGSGGPSNPSSGDGGSGGEDGSNTASSGEDSSTGAEEPPVTECNDGIDNDGDGLVDWMFDLGCVGQTDLTEGGRPTMSQENGWTVFEPVPDTRIVYVSQSGGDDTNDGSSPSPGPDGIGPVRSLAHASSMVRSGSADWLLLRRGDTWEEGFGSWTASGRAPTEPVLIASYGESTSAPVVRGDLYISGEDGAAGGSDNVAIANLRFEYAGVFSQLGSDILIEGCHFSQGLSGIIVEGESTKLDWRIRRNTIDRTISSGIYVNGVTGVQIEGNVVYRPAQDEANHGMYITRRGNSGVEVRDNLVFMGKSTGNAIMMRPGGIAEGNVVVDFGWSGVSAGSCDDGDGGPCFDPVDAVVRSNVFLEGHADIGVAINFDDGFVLPGAEIVDNIVAASSGEAFAAVSVTSGVDDLVLEDNIFYNATPVAIYGLNRNMRWRNNTWRNDLHDRPLVSVFDPQSADGLVAEGNTFFAAARPETQWFELPGGEGGVDAWQAFSGERASSIEPRWVDDERTLASFSVSLGGESSSEAFVLRALEQRRLAFEDDYTTAAVIEYFREGYRAAGG